MQVHELSAGELAAAYAAGRLSPVEAMRDVLAHSARWEPHLRALYAPDPDGALEAARASESRWQTGRPLSPLDGVPVTVKENIATRGVPVPLGTAATELTSAAADAPPAARLREAGALIWAKTTMPDQGMLSSGLSSFHALSRNPWNLAKTPGGSSAGAGAAAAAGYGPLHLGTDIGGSIRLPAGWCGVVGFKPSAGRIPIHPPYTGRVAGPLARTVSDVALAMQVLARPDARDATQLPAQAIAWTDLGIELKSLRLGLLLDAGWGMPPTPATLTALRDAAQRFAAAGAVVERLAPFSTRTMIDGLDRFWRMRSWLELQALPPKRRERVLPYIRDWAASAASLTAPELFLAHAQIAALRDATVAAFRPFDFVLSPVSPVPAFDAELASPLHDPQQPFEHIAFTVPYNMGEQPAIAVPCAMSADGLPISLQIAGHRHDDLGVLRLARAWERLRPALPPWPEPRA